MIYEARCCYCGGIIGCYMTASKCEGLLSEFCSQECMDKAWESCGEVEEEREEGEGA